MNAEHLAGGGGGSRKEGRERRRDMVSERVGEEGGWKGEMNRERQENSPSCQ